MTFWHLPAWFLEAFKFFPFKAFKGDVIFFFVVENSLRMKFLSRDLYQPCKSNFGNRVGVWHWMWNEFWMPAWWYSQKKNQNWSQIASSSHLLLFVIVLVIINTRCFRAFGVEGTQLFKSAPIYTFSSGGKIQIRSRNWSFKIYRSPPDLSNDINFIF